MIAYVGRKPADGEAVGMTERALSERFEVLRDESSLTFYALTSSQSAYGKSRELEGTIDAAWGSDGTLLPEPNPNVHVEFKVESLRTGNELQDREMWKLIDSKRFPKIAGDLLSVGTSTQRGKYVASGRITLAGLARTYEGELGLSRDGDSVTCDGELHIDVRDFGLKPMKLLVLGVAPLVRVRVHVVTKRIS